MPSKSYMRLSPEKKKKILDAAFQEFSVKNVEHASMGAIAKNAGISRTTLYYYFTDINDIFMLVMDTIMERFRESMNYGEGNPIDIFEGYYQFFKYVSSFKGTEYEGFVKTIFSEMNIKLQNIITGPYINFFISNKSYVKDLDKLDYENREELLDILFALFSLITVSINYYYKSDIEFEIIDHKFRRGLRLLRYGVVKEKYRKEELKNE